MLKQKIGLEILSRTILENIYGVHLKPNIPKNLFCSGIGSSKELYEAFKITARTYYQWVAIEQATGGLACSTSHGRPRVISREALKRAVEAQPDLYLREYAAAFGCSASAVYQIFKEERMTLKKHSLTRKACYLPFKPLHGGGLLIETRRNDQDALNGVERIIATFITVYPFSENIF
jgi:hypothetical protein